MKLYWRGPFRALQSLLGFLCVLSLSQACSAKSKDDVVIMKNGDRMTGEIKQLDHGLLDFKSKYMIASVQLDWNEVASLQTKDPFIITLPAAFASLGPLSAHWGNETDKRNLSWDPLPGKWLFLLTRSSKFVRRRNRSGSR